MMDIENRHWAILEHALGMKGGRLPENITRALYLASKGTAENTACRELVAMGYMEIPLINWIAEDMQLYHVTKHCIDLLRRGEQFRELVIRSARGDHP